jgi:uncharacterized protein (UPF0371 family)
MVIKEVAQHIEKKGFDVKKYRRAEEKELKKRVKFFSGRLYLEIGGKLYSDNHAARVLPGYDPDTKIGLLKKFSKKIDLVHCISSKMIWQGKMRGDSHVLYSDQLINDIKYLKSKGIESEAVFISRISESTKHATEAMKRKIEKEFGKNRIKVLFGYEIPRYPKDIKIILSNRGYGLQQYLFAKKEITSITAPGPGSGKMAFCMAQMFNDRKDGIRSGYAKIETFPVYNLPLNHPVNIAYEAATADIGDFNVIDRFHKAAYGITAVNYNRDVENFAILKKIIDGMTAESDPLRSYKSPTDMGISMIKIGIMNDRVVRKAAEAEIVRRYYSYKQGFKSGYVTKTTMKRMEKILKNAGLEKKVI